MLAFLVRWVGVVAGVVEPVAGVVDLVAGVDCGAGGLETDLIVSSPPPAANTAIVGAVAMIPPERTVSVANLIANLDMLPVCSKPQPFFGALLAMRGQ